MGSPSLMIISILVIWIIVLAPLMIGNNKPIRRSGEGYDETRVLHEGGTAPMAERRRPKLTAADIHRHSEDTDYEVVEATDAEEQVLIDDAPALRTLFRRPGAEEDAAAADHIDGEVIEHVDDEAETAEAEAEPELDNAEGGSTKIVASEPAGSTSVKVLGAEDAAENDAENADADRYELDESYTAPEDFGYAGETGGVEKQPCAAPPQLVAGAFDEEAAGGEPRAHRAPHVRNLVHVVLPQHVERAHHGGRPRHGQLEAADRPGDPRQAAGPLPRPGHPSGVDLEAHQLEGRVLHAQPLGHLDGGHRLRAEAQVHGQRAGSAPQQGAVHVREPAVHPAHPLRRRRAAGDVALRAPCRDWAGRRARAQPPGLLHHGLQRRGAAGRVRLGW